MLLDLSTQLHLALHTAPPGAISASSPKSPHRTHLKFFIFYWKSLHFALHTGTNLKSLHVHVVGNFVRIFIYTYIYIYIYIYS